jgi:hypothetical protein
MTTTQVTIIDNSGIENYLIKGEMYKVLEEKDGDMFSYYRLDVTIPYQEGLWVNKNRCEEVKYLITTPLPVSPIKPTTERIICIPDENGHIVDLQRVQYVSPLNDKCYSVTLVSGWEIKLMDEVYKREKLVSQWRMLQNK